MYSVPYEIIVASKPFRFVVGPDKNEFFMHAEVVARMSRPLRALVNGEWKESKGCLVEWPEIDVGTFVRFFEYAYTADYKAAEPFFENPPTPPELENDELSETPTKEPLEEPIQEPIQEPGPNQEPEPIPEPIHDLPDPWGSLLLGGIKKKKHKKCSHQCSTSKKDVMWSEFQKGVISGLPPLSLGARDLLRNTDPLANYSEVFLSHARLYALADCYAIDGLINLCIGKLHSTLTVFDLHGGTRATDVVQLVDFSYKNTRSDSVGQDKLRSLLAAYTACHIEELWPDICFQDVLESGDVSKAIIGQLLKRVD
ncbi:hypothetical protein F4781DRAFT_374257 [Annulohypoxylon bovei var. microspora]|nr:hypothetical protein F4781DRAFT_374257 [Annulohypoxylon bovei var. microspora]